MVEAVERIPCGVATLTGASVYITGKSLGHKSQQATAIYARLNLDPVRASVELATEAMSWQLKVSDL